MCVLSLTTCFIQESVKDAEYDTYIQKCETDVICDKYLGMDKLLQDANDESARLGEIVSLHSLKIAEISQQRKVLSSELANLKYQFNHLSSVASDYYKTITRLQHELSQVRPRKPCPPPVSFNLSNLIPEALVSEDVFYSSGTQSRNTQRVNWLIHHSGSTPLKLSMFHLKSDEIVSVKDNDGGYLSYVHFTTSGRVNVLCRFLEEAETVVSFKISDCLRGMERFTRTFRTIAAGVVSRNAHFETSKQCETEAFALFRRFMVPAVSGGI
jgi:hypothetical protein